MEVRGWRCRALYPRLARISLGNIDLMGGRTEGETSESIATPWATGRRRGQQEKILMLYALTSQGES